LNADDILREVQDRGVRLLVKDGKIMASPSGRLDRDLREKVRMYKSDLIDLLTSDPDQAGKTLPPLSVPDVPSHSRSRIGRTEKPSGDTLSHLRRLSPNLWRTVRIRDGRVGLLWRVGPLDVAVSFDPSGPILTLSPSEVECIEI